VQLKRVQRGVVAVSPKKGGPIGWRSGAENGPWNGDGSQIGAEAENGNHMGVCLGDVEAVEPEPVNACGGFGYRVEKFLGVP
jgi:hypothetical protein